jgi:DNA-binding NarL/FixJ family response regulator
LLKAGANALFDPDFPFEELLFALQEIRPGNVLLNELVDQALLKKVKSAVGQSAKDFSKEEVMLVRDICKGLNDVQILDKHKLTKSRLSMPSSTCVPLQAVNSRPDFIRFAMMNKIIKQDENLLARAELAVA